MNRKISICFALFILVLISCERKPLFTKEKNEISSVPKVVIEKEKLEKPQPPAPEVKIRLKKDGKDSYSWELNGSDVDQILKVNEKLRKQLGENPSR